MPSRLCPTYKIYTRAGTGVESPSPAVTGRAPGAARGPRCTVRGSRAVRAAKRCPRCVLLNAVFIKTPHQDSKGGARGAAGAGARGNPHHPLRKGSLVYLHVLQYFVHVGISTCTCRNSTHTIDERDNHSGVLLQDGRTLARDLATRPKRSRRAGMACDIRLQPHKLG